MYDDHDDSDDLVIYENNVTLFDIQKHVFDVENIVKKLRPMELYQALDFNRDLVPDVYDEIMEDLDNKYEFGVPFSEDDKSFMRKVAHLSSVVYFVELE